MVRGPRTAIKSGPRSPQLEKAGSVHLILFLQTKKGQSILAGEWVTPYVSEVYPKIHLQERSLQCGNSKNDLKQPNQHQQPDQVKCGTSM